METKKQFKRFTIFEYEKEQDYLREMHRSGWKFVKVSGVGMYYFEKCTPEDVVYQLDYNKDGLENKDEYLKMFDDCGWEYIQDYVGYSYFRKAVSEDGVAEEIFCDDASRLDMMKRVLKGRLIPILINFFLILISQMIKLSLGNLPFKYAFLTLFWILFVVYVGVFISFAISYRKFYKSIHK